MPIRMTGMVSGLDTESLVSALVSSYAEKKKKYEKAQTKLEWKNDAWKSVNTQVHDLYSKLNSLRFSSGYNMKKTSVSDATKAKVTAGGNAPNGMQKLEVTRLAQSGSLTGGERNKLKGAKGSTKMSELGFSGTDEITLSEGGKAVGGAISVSEDMTVDQFIAKLKDKGVQANFDSKNGRIFINSKKSGEASELSLTGTQNGANSALSVLGLNSEPSDWGEGVSAVHGQSAEIYLNGVKYTNDTNSFSINGLSIEATGLTTATEGIRDESKAITITTSTDTQGLYDKIKDFFTQYNEVMNSMSKQFNAGSSKGYEPLSDDERAAMSDSQIEKWEAKIKDSLLRRDDTLGSIINTMSNAMMRTFKYGDDTMSLSSLGIKTLGYFGSAKNENYAYHIDGDSDDEAVSGNVDKLMAALTENPDKVIDFMKDLTQGLYDDLDKKMKSTTMRSAYTIYNDKEMASEYSDYTDLIKNWDQKLKKLEDSYFAKFAKMESALSALQSNSSYLSGMMR